MVCLASSILVSPVFAQSNGQLTKILKEANSHYDNLELDQAKNTLTEGIELAEKKGVENGTVAELYLMLGIVEFAKSRNQKAVEYAFRKALSIDSSVEIDPVYRTPKLMGMFEDARQAISTVDWDEALSHTGMESAVKREPIDIRVTLDQTDKSVDLVLKYRRFSEVDFTSKQMKPSRTDGLFVATIPGSEVYSQQIEYFVDVLDSNGERLAGVGTSSNPMSVTLKGKTSATKPEKSEDKKRDDKGKQPDEPVDDKGFRGESYGSLSGGSGTSYLFGGQPTANPDRNIAPGVAPTFAHIMLEGGMALNERIDLGLYFRWQMIPTQNFAQIPNESRRGGFPTTDKQCLGFGLVGDCLLGVKARRDLSWSPFGSDVYFLGGLGVGRIRDWVRLRESPDSPACTGKQIYETPNGERFCYLRDTVRPGWFHAKVGVGGIWPITESIGLKVEGYTMFLAPDTAMHLDLNAGFEYQF